MKRYILPVVAALSIGGSALAADKASFPGGEKALNDFISKNMIYPKMAKENGVEGVVTVNFVVKADGTIEKLSIKRRVDPDLEAEAMRIVRKMPKWTPADSGDSNASATIRFRL